MIYTSQAVLTTSPGRKTKFLMTSLNVLDENHEKKLTCRSCHLVRFSTRKDCLRDMWRSSLDPTWASRSFEVCVVWCVSHQTSNSITSRPVAMSR